MLQKQPTTRVVAVMGSYRRGGTIDSAVSEVLAGAREQGAQTEKIDLIDRHLEFCRNCRECTRQPGSARGECVLDDDLDDILSSLEQADGIVLGAPVNFDDVNALTRQFLERMVGFTYWPWEAKAPQLRRARADRPAILVTSSAAPSVLTRLFARPVRTLKRMARLLGARPAGSLVIGLAARPQGRFGEREQRRARALGRRLVARAAATASRDLRPTGAGSP